MYKHILIPTDGSELSEKAIKQGLALAKRLQEFWLVTDVRLASRLGQRSPRLLSPRRFIRSPLTR